MTDEDRMLYAKVEAYHRYVRARRLWECHTSGRSTRRAKLRAIAAEYQAKVMKELEAEYPDFDATYEARKRK